MKLGVEQLALLTRKHAPAHGEAGCRARARVVWESVCTLFHNVPGAPNVTTNICHSHMLRIGWMCEIIHWSLNGRCDKQAFSLRPDCAEYLSNMCALSVLDESQLSSSCFGIHDNWGKSAVDGRSGIHSGSVRKEMRKIKRGQGI